MYFQLREARSSSKKREVQVCAQNCLKQISLTHICSPAGL